MKAELIEKAYAVAKDRYAAIGVDTDAVLDQLQQQQISLHCWQTDDVVGFERPALIPLSLNWARAVVLVEAMVNMNIRRLNMFITLGI